MEKIPLTAEQQAVVAHDTGPALVFAVAGAGKTTAMVHRIERLVRTKVFAPNQILATSFGKGNERDLRTALNQWQHCQGVQISTLHALGYDIIKNAQAQQLLPNPAYKIDISKLNHHILNAALGESRKRNVHYKRELDGLDRQDFLDYVGRCKSSLAYADLSLAALPNGTVAKQAKAPSAILDWYLPLYQLFEMIRQSNGWITFDDMLQTSWELLQRHESLREAMQMRFQTVLVDEFQDINLAQSEILDLLTEGHRNYMAIGDDDQTIYEWRGAHPRYILDFPKRYDSATYVISDNFRCTAGPLVVANRVIRNNRQRQAKQLQLTKGFGGQARVHINQSIDQMAEDIVDCIEKSHADGLPLNEMAVLVRLNAQTPPIEQKLITRNIPYRVSLPFYDRPEIKVLIAYCRLAWFEKHLGEGKKLGSAHIQAIEEAWGLVHNRPKRYISRDMRQNISRAITQLAQRPTDALRQLAHNTSSDYVADRLEQFADDLTWLTSRLNQDARATLRQLDARLGYQSYLRDSSGLAQTGEGRAISVASFITYADSKGTLTEFLQHIRVLAQQKIGRNAGGAMVTISTIHQAKGLEWPLVIIPNCNHGIMPFTDTFAAQVDVAAHLEEERRLFYVAVTRSSQNLHLHVVKGEQPSQFITEAQIPQTQSKANALHRAISRPASVWLARDKQAAHDALTVIQNGSYLGIERFLAFYWQESEKRTVIQHFAAVLTSMPNLAQQLQLKQEQLTLWLGEDSAETAQHPFPGIRLLTAEGTVITPS